MDSVLPIETTQLRKTVVSTKTKNMLLRFMQWESWPWLLKYIPLLPWWIFYSMRARSLCFFTASNPRIHFGGFDGESKRQIYAQLPSGSFPRSFFISPDIVFDELKTLVTARFSFPIAVKPDVGRMGLLFRKLSTLEELERYHNSMEVDYIIQEFVDLPMEVSIFYYRFPNERKGTISGFVKKEYPEVVGNGMATLRELILTHNQLKHKHAEIFIKHQQNLDVVIPDGQRYCVSFALNLSRGARLVSLADQIDDQLIDIFDQISHQSEFYYGRYDIKCESIEALKEGKYQILEFNGAGAEPHHVYGNNNSLHKALNILRHHWDVLATISHLNNKAGIKYWSLGDGIREVKRIYHHVKYLQRADREQLNR